ncbi:9804_t:CDS:2, partial [Acaulospora morrowiae]
HSSNKTNSLESSSLQNSKIPTSSFKDSLTDEESVSQQRQGIALNQLNVNSHDAELLKGYSLGIFSPDNSIRQWFFDVLNKPWTEPVILCLIVVNIILLVADAWVPFVDSPNAPVTPQNIWGSSSTDYGLLVVFIIFTIEMLARIVVSGLIFGPEKSTRTSSSARPNSNRPHHSKTPSITLSQLNSRQTLYNIPFLRHTFNRTDLLAVCSYWIDLALTIAGVQHFLLFRALSTLRGVRLLSITSGTYTILQSLKKSLPLLFN